MRRLHDGDGDWMERSACATDPKPDDWHNLHDVRPRLLCLDCPVLTQCRDFVDEAERDIAKQYWAGIWAGEDPDQREIRRNRVKVLRAAFVDEGLMVG